MKSTIETRRSFNIFSIVDSLLSLHRHGQINVENTITGFLPNKMRLQTFEIIICFLKEKEMQIKIKKYFFWWFVWVRGSLGIFKIRQSKYHCHTSKPNLLVLEHKFAKRIFLSFFFSFAQRKYLCTLFFKRFSFSAVLGEKVIPVKIPLRSIKIHSEPSLPVPIVQFEVKHSMLYVMSFIYCLTKLFSHYLLKYI